MSAPRGRRVPLVDNVCLSLFSSVESRQFNLQPEILRLFRHYGHQDDLHQDLSKTINSMKTVYSPGGKSHSLSFTLFNKLGPCHFSPTRRYWKRGYFHFPQSPSTTTQR